MFVSFIILFMQVCQYHVRLTCVHVLSQFTIPLNSYKLIFFSVGEFKLNIECNHATLSGHRYIMFLFSTLLYMIILHYCWRSYGNHLLCSCHHELETARLNGLLGNIDANTGDPQIGILNSYWVFHEFFNINSLMVGIINGAFKQVGILISFSQILGRQPWLWLVWS